MKAPARLGQKAGANTTDTPTIARQPTNAQVGDGRKTAARYAGTMLRESRSIAAAIQAHGIVAALQGQIRRLRDALDSLEWLLDYITNESDA